MATSNAATTYMEHALLQFLFKNNTESFATPGNSIYVGLATAVSSIETGSLTEATFGSYARQQVQASGWTVPTVGTDAQTATNAANAQMGGCGYVLVIVSRYCNSCLGQFVLGIWVGTNST